MLARADCDLLGARTNTLYWTGFELAGRGADRALSTRSMIASRLVRFCDCVVVGEGLRGSEHIVYCQAPPLARRTAHGPGPVAHMWRRAARAHASVA